MSRWFRHYAGMMRDDKLVSVAIRSKQSIERVVWVWGAILESAAEIDDNGRFDVDPAEIAYFLRADEADILNVVAGLENAGRIAANFVVKWGDRQFSSDRSAARQAAYRERKRAENVGSDDNETSPNGGVTSLSRHADAPETETETETELDKKSEAKASSPRASRKSDDFPCPDGVDPVDWSSLLAARKANHKAMNAGAYRQIITKLARWTDAGWPPGPIVANAVERGWLTVFETDEMKNGQLGRNNGNAQGRPQQRSGGSVTEDAARSVAAKLGITGPGLGSSPRPTPALRDAGGTHSLPHPSGAYGNDEGRPRELAYRGNG